MIELQSLVIHAERQNGALLLAGELSGDDAARLERWFSRLELHETPARLELAELDIVDGVAATHMLNIVRLILHRCGQATLNGAPQLLAHNLYRAGLLFDGCAITLSDMREDEPYG